MYFIKTDDPLRDFDNWDKMNRRWLSKRLKCNECGEYIQDDYYYCIKEEIYCEKCVEEFKKYID